MVLLSSASRCPMCNERFTPGRKRMVIRAFARNQLHPLFAFSGACVHVDCFDAHPLRDEIVRRAAEAEAHAEPSTWACAACGDPIASNDLYSPGRLTDDPSHPLFPFNYLTLHRSHLGTWSGYARFRELAVALQASSAYEGPPILPTKKPYTTPLYRVGRAYDIKDFKRRKE